ncbi:MAG: NAD-dependent epimerase/dehydratase family protein [Promethearchaeota archaeon]
MKKKNILLTGASGVIGKEILREFISQSENYELRLLLRPSRKNKKYFKSYRDSLDIIWGNIQNFEDVKKSVSNQDIVIHAAGVLPDVALYDPELTKLTNIGGTKNIVNAIKEQQNNPKVIFTSSAAVYNEKSENLFIRNSDLVDPNPTDVYAYTKIEAEKLIINSGIEYCIFRISYVASVDMLKFRPIMFHIPLDTSLEIIHVKEVAQAIVNSIESDRIWGKIFNLGGGKDCQILYKENLSDYYEMMGFGRDFLPETAFAKIGHYGGIFDPQETQDLQNLLKYQHRTLQSFYSEVKKWVGVKRHLFSLIRPIAKWYILRRSEFYRDFKK